jgi:hypothetical protein
VTGLRIINGGGRAEAQAAHIKPVAAGGPDVVQNGIALSATVHWLFDRHLISIDEDFRLLVTHNRVPRELVNFLRPQQERLLLPDDRRLCRPKRSVGDRHPVHFGLVIAGAPLAQPRFQICPATTRTAMTNGCCVACRVLRCALAGHAAASRIFGKRPINPI